MITSKILNKKGNHFFTKDTETKPDDLLKLIRKSHKSINQYKELIQSIHFIQTQINKTKKILSQLSSYGKKSDKNINKEIEKYLGKTNGKLLRYKKSLLNELNDNKEKMKINLLILGKNTQQQAHVLDSLKNKNFILENKLKEKDSIIQRVSEILFEAQLGYNNGEIIKDLEPEYFGKEEKIEEVIENELFINQEKNNGLLLYKSMKFNKIKNKTFRLSEKKTELLDAINEYHHPKDKFKNIKKEKISLGHNTYKNNSALSNDIMIPTNITSEDSMFSMNDSLCFDTEDQIDIEFPENDFSSYFLSQKSFGFNVVKKHIKIPPLNIELIKNKIREEDSSSEEKSLSREFENDIDKKIKEMKKKIKLYTKQNNNLDLKCQKFEKKIQQLALFLYSNEKNIFSINNSSINSNDNN